MVYIISDLKKKRQSLAWQGRPPEIRKLAPYQKPISENKDIKISETETKHGNKVIKVEVKNKELTDNEKQRFIKNTFGHETTQNGHGTVVVMDDVK